MKTAKTTTAEAYAQNASRDRCIELLREIDVDSFDEEARVPRTTRRLRELLTENIASGTINPSDFNPPVSKTAKQTIRSEKDERAAWVQRRRENHHRALETLAQTVGCETPGLVLWRQLRRIENPLHYNAERYCNGDIDSEQWEVIKNQYRNRLAKVFGGRVPTGVFINGDPRGHALFQ